MLFASCDNFLDREPESLPMVGSFYQSEQEMIGGLTGVYSTVKWIKNASSATIQTSLNGWDDFGLARSPEIGEGNHKTNDGTIANFWDYAYETIHCANSFIHGMARGKSVVSQEKYDTMQAEAKIIRAWAYFWLINLFGDVPYFTEPLESKEYYNQTRTSKEEIVQNLYKDLNDAAPHLDWLPVQRGRVSRSVAYGLKSRIAFYHKDYKTAADAANVVIQEAGLGLNPNYLDLFQYSKQKANVNHEIMFELMYSYDQIHAYHHLPMIIGSRNAGSWSGMFPGQSLVDQFECTDGKRIDESELYNPQKPNENRDSRLKVSISMPGDRISSFSKPDFIYDVHNPTTDFWDESIGGWKKGTNQDYSNVYGPRLNGVGYLYGKYSYGDKSETIERTRQSFIFMRYAEILLTYAEAKIELNELDADVIAAINKVRKRAKQPILEESGIDVTSQYEMRRLIRRERNVELCGENFRWLDIRRWGIAEITMPGSVYGCASTAENVQKMKVPTFGSKGSINDLNNIPTYSDTEYRFKRDNRVFEVPKHYLFPIPQSECDLNKNLNQNEGW